MDIIREYEFEKNEVESIEKIQLLKCGIIRIEYTITDEYKEKNQMFYKHRVIEIDNSLDEIQNVPF